MVTTNRVCTVFQHNNEVVFVSGDDVVRESVVYVFSVRESLMRAARSPEHTQVSL
jgi:hypothetical protein